MMHACTLVMEVRIPESGSLKAKRAVIKHVIETCRSRFGVAAAEVSYQGKWQRSEVGFAAVSGSPGHVVEVLDTVERFVWSQPDLEIVAGGRCWLEAE
jgi:uncharacterized protein YlxP (DUF503 family)